MIDMDLSRVLGSTPPVKATRAKRQRTAPAPVISDHALLRWLERVHGINVELFRAQLAAEVKDYTGAGLTRLSKNGVVYCFKGDTLATVIAG